MVCLAGMDGTELWWTGPVPQESWTPYSLPLTPEAFSTNSVVFNQVMAYVKELRIYGEVGSGTDRAALDTFGLYLNRPSTVWPEQASTFDAGMEEWHKFAGVTLGWESSGGNPGGFLKGYNDGSGVWHYVSPEIWNGDWTGYKSLRFDHVILAGNNGEWNEPTFYILGANNETLEWKGPEASNEWVRFAANLGPELFGVDQAAYDAVMEHVVEVRIRGEYVSGSESEGLDNVFLSTSPLPGSPSAPVLFVAVGETQLSIAFQTELNVVYGLEATTNLVEGVGWVDIPGKTVLGDGGEATIEMDLSDPDLPVRHFRLRAN